MAHCLSMGPLIRRTRNGTRMDRHCATRRLHRLAQTGGVHAARMHPHMLRHTFVTTMLDAAETKLYLAPPRARSAWRMPVSASRVRGTPARSSTPRVGEARDEGHTQ